MHRALLLRSEVFARAELETRVRHVEALDYESVWLPEMFGREPFTTATWLLARTSRLCVATGVANAYARDALVYAQARATLAELSGGRFLLGLGVSNAAVNARRGHAWQPPQQKMAELLDAMRTAALTLHGVPGAPLHLAAHAPALQALALAHADGVVQYLMPPAHCARVRAHVGPVLEVSAVVPFLFEREPAQARTKARAFLAPYVPLAYYQARWRALGFADADFAGGGSDALVDALVCWGEASALVHAVQAYADAGVSRLVVSPVEPDVAGAGYARLLALLAPGA